MDVTDFKAVVLESLVLPTVQDFMHDVRQWIFIIVFFFNSRFHWLLPFDVFTWLKTIRD